MAGSCVAWQAFEEPGRAATSILLDLSAGGNEAGTALSLVNPSFFPCAPHPPITIAGKFNLARCRIVRGGDRGGLVRQVS